MSQDNLKELAKVATDLTDHDVMIVGKIVGDLMAKYSDKPNTPENLDHLRDEALTRLAEAGILATLDPAPCFYGEPPVLEILGKVGDPGFTAEFDHERKQYEVIKSKERGEDYLGQKESYNKLKPRKK